MYTKIKQITERINPHGGINLVMKMLRGINVKRAIDKHLGARVRQATYSYGDVIMSWIYANLSGAERLEDIEQERVYFNDMPSYQCPSTDRVGFLFKRLACENIEVKSKSNAKHEFNSAPKMNALLMKIACSLARIKSGEAYTLDYDNVLIPTEKYDSQFTYKGFTGYQPGVAFIGKTPVYIEGRSGSCPASYKMLDTLKRCLQSLKENNIAVGKFRSDAAAYQKEIIQFMDGEGIEFFIRVSKNPRTFEDYNILKWEEVTIGNVQYELAESTYALENDRGKTISKPFRIVFHRRKKSSLSKEKQKESEMVIGDYVISALITNNYKMTNEQVLAFYNQRGAIELNFTNLLNDFNWKRIPFSFLSQNTVFMIVEAIAYILFQHVMDWISELDNSVRNTTRLKRFIFRIIDMAAYWRDGILHYARNPGGVDFERLWNASD